MIPKCYARHNDIITCAQLLQVGGFGRHPSSCGDIPFGRCRHRWHRDTGIRSRDLDNQDRTPIVSRLKAYFHGTSRPLSETGHQPSSFPTKVRRTLMLNMSSWSTSMAPSPRHCIPVSIFWRRLRPRQLTKEWERNQQGAAGTQAILSEPKRAS